jgi:transposase
MSWKYFCDNCSCPRKVFTERFAKEISPHGRRLIRSNNLLCKIALKLGGNKGAAISRFIGILVSPSTILRIIKRFDIPNKTLSSGIIGLDDWAFKKRNTYGTIIVDLKNNEVIDLLPDRSPDTMAKWLKSHPEVQIVSRDRYGPYALAIQQGAPHSIQVADRFHLIMNLGEATKRMFQSNGKILKEAVNNAVITSYNYGQVEDQINRLKNIKRAMYGKASFQLLRKMVLASAE